MDSVGPTGPTCTMGVIKLISCLLICISFGYVGNSHACKRYEEYWDSTVNQCSSCSRICNPEHADDVLCRDYCPDYLEYLQNGTVVTSTVHPSTPAAATNRPTHNTDLAVIIPSCVITFVIVCVLVICRKQIIDKLKQCRIQRTRGPIHQETEADQPMNKQGVCVDVENQEAAFRNVQRRE